MERKELVSAYQEANKRAADDLKVLNRVVERHRKEQERARDEPKAKKK